MEKMSTHAIKILDCRQTHNLHDLDTVHDEETRKLACNDDPYRIFSELERKPSHIYVMCDEDGLLSL